jgi:type IV pilus assembly protein PilB
MDCTEVRRRFDDILDDSLNGESKAAVQEHLDKCGECRKELQRTGDVIAAIEAAHDEPAVKLCDAALQKGIDARASDIHLQCGEEGLRVRYRVDGVLHDAMKLPAYAWPSLLTRLMILSEMNVAERRVPQDGRIHYEYEGTPYDLRVSFAPTIGGGQVVMRVLSERQALLGLDQLGFSQVARRQVETLLDRPAGLAIVTGPTGSGKTTTLYAMLTHLNSVEKHLLTVEDPVEYRLPGVGQTAVNRKALLTFCNALRTFMRQDPDVIMVGEIRDLETAELIMQATITGHLMLSTLHTRDAASVPERLLDMGMEPFLIANALCGAVAQRLVRRVCETCRDEADLPGEVRRSLAQAGAAVTCGTFCRGAGCDQCRKSGYRGRIAVHEVMTMTPALAELILRRADVKAVRQQALKDGMVSMLEDGIRKAAEGSTTVEEVLRVVRVPE